LKETGYNPVYFDTETTGTRVNLETGNVLRGVKGYERASGGRIMWFVDLISLAGVSLTGEVFNKTVNPPRQYIEKVDDWWSGNTVDVADCLNSPSAWSVVRSFVRWLSQVEATHLVAHNVAFDTKVLIDSYAYCVGADRGEVHSGLLTLPLIDSRDSLKEAFISKKSLHGPSCGATCDGGRLTHIAHINGLGPYAEHDALADVTILKDCCALLEQGWENTVAQYEYQNYSR